QSRSHHLDLHSFPTRRSSDLMLRKVDAQLQQSRLLIGAVGAIAMHYDDGALRRQFTVGEYAWNEPALQLHLVDAAGSFQAYSPTDRKSTRLNSSHVETSYAVF